MVRKRILFHNPLSPGDVLVNTAVIRDLHLAYPGQFLTGYKGTAQEIMENNPYITPMGDGGGMVVEMQYPAIHQSNQRPVHFITAYHEYVSMGLGLPIPVTSGRPDVHLSPEEMSWDSQIKHLVGEDVPFWIIVCGGKTDYTIKWWNSKYATELVSSMSKEVLFVQVGAHDHVHDPIPGVIDLRGKTSTRQLMRLCYHSSGVVTPISFMMHLAAAFNKPAVVTAGGREPVAWESYPDHQYLHTVGALPCCQTSACWKSRVVPLSDGSDKDSSLCEMPETGGGKPVARCMKMIPPRKVEEALRLYLPAHPNMLLTKAHHEAIKPFLSK